EKFFVEGHEGFRARRPGRWGPPPPPRFANLTHSVSRAGSKSLRRERGDLGAEQPKLHANNRNRPARLSHGRFATVSGPGRVFPGEAGKEIWSNQRSRIEGTAEYRATETGIGIREGEARSERLAPCGSHGGSPSREFRTSSLRRGTEDAPGLGAR